MDANLEYVMDRTFVDEMKNLAEGLHSEMRGIAGGIYAAAKRGGQEHP